jgi:transposase
MRGEERQQRSIVMDVEQRIPQDHPLRRIKQVTDTVLKNLSPIFDQMYGGVGRPSVPPERLLKASLLMALYTIRSERLFCEQLDYNLLFRWFLDMEPDEKGFDHFSFASYRKRLLEREVAGEFFRAVVEQARALRLLSSEHFTVDGTLTQAEASLRAVMQQPDANEPDARGPEVQGHVSCSPVAGASCPPHAALAAYRESVRLDGTPQRGRELQAKQRDQIRNHLRDCSHCQTRLVAGPENDRHSVELQAAARDQVNCSLLSPMRAMQIAGIAASLVAVVWMTTQPKQLAGRAVAIIQASVGEACYLVETGNETLVKAFSSAIGTASRGWEAAGHPLTEKLRPAQSQASGQNTTLATWPTASAEHSQLQNFELQDGLVADNSNKEDFSSGTVNLTAKDHPWAGHTPPSGHQENKPPASHHFEPDRLYSTDQANSVIRRFRALGYTAHATPVESGDETMYKIEVRQKVHKHRRARRRG